MFEGKGEGEGEGEIGRAARMKAVAEGGRG